MKTYNVYVTREAVSRNNRADSDWRTVAYQRNVRADGFGAAVAKCENEIWKLVDPDIAVVSVHCGIKGNVTANASRLAPIQIRR